MSKRERSLNNRFDILLIVVIVVPKVLKIKSFPFFKPNQTMKRTVRFSSFLIILLVSLREIAGDSSNCIDQETCGACLSEDFACAWCTDREYSIANPRCMIKDELLRMGCGSGHILENSEHLEIIEDRSLQDYVKNGKANQIRPQKAKLTLVKGHTSEIQLTYRPARNNPLDLYYLLDLTYSMEDDRQTLVKVGNRLVKTLGELTENYRLGFGSFSDKPTMPMIMPGTEENPCRPAAGNCEPAYDFRHHLSLTTDMKEFTRRVNESRTTGNLDNLEGTLDALMQVIVCTDRIGWSEDARKIVIVATDGLMHFAGDGLLAGIVKRNDRKCHLDKDGLYDGALEFDYPSLEEIYRELLRRKINVIFAATKDIASKYFSVVELMPDVSSADILREDSSNILDLVAEGYKKLARQVNFVDTSPPNIDVIYKTDCGIPGGRMLERQSCDNLNIGEEVKFSIGFKANDFPEDGIYHHKIRIEETGLSEYLEVDVEIQKSCPCTPSNKTDILSRRLCNGHGEFDCGMCYCDKGWIGKTCLCNSQDGASDATLMAQCRPASVNSKQGALCSDRGECECGQCFCFLGFEGKYCECPMCSDSCNLDTADCNCGDCVCKPGWTGPDCDCKESTDSCQAPTGEICSGQGRCRCGKCQCNSMFYGTYCEVNSTASQVENKICQYYGPCVEALLREKRDEEVDITSICKDSDKTPFSYSFTGALGEESRQCISRVTFKDGITCDFPYTYGTKYSRKQLYIEWTDSCFQQTNVALIAGMALIATLLAGLFAICCYKIFIVYEDRREYAKFTRQVSKEDWQTEMSPLYRDPNVKYQVPDLDGADLN